MELITFVKNFADQFPDSDVGTISSESKFRELEEWSSFHALSIIAMVDEEYNVNIKAEDIRNSITINDLFLIVESRRKPING
jgi:acyl carrier protein